MLKKVVFSFMIAVLPISQASASDLAIIFAYDCEYHGQFGSALSNEITVLDHFGWDVRYYCGDEEMSFRDVNSLAMHRKGSFREEHVLQELDSLPEKSNIMVIFNTHGGPADYVQEKDNGDQIIALGKVDVFNDMNYTWVSQIMKRLTNYQHRNPDSFVFHINDSCFSGRSVQYIEANSTMCSLSMAPDNEVGYSNNYWEMAFQAMPASNGNYMYGSGEPENAFEGVMGQKYSDGYLSDLNKIQFDSMTVNDVIKSPLWFDRTTISFYTHGFGLDILNIEDDSEFLERYKFLADNFKGPAKRSADELILKFQKRIENRARLYEDFTDPDVYQQSFFNNYWNNVQKAIRQDRVLIRQQMNSCTLKVQAGAAISCQKPEKTNTEFVWDLFIREIQLENWFFNQHDFTPSCYIEPGNGGLGLLAQDEADQINSIITDGVCVEILKVVSSPQYQSDLRGWRKLRDQRRFENSAYNMKQFHDVKKFDHELENGKLRNQMMSIALSETRSRCGEFNLDRRKGI